MGYDPNEARDGVGRWSRMGKQARAKLTASARFDTKLSGPSKNSKGKATGLVPRSIRTGFSTYEPSHHAVAITTAKALDKDFARNKEKSAEASMNEAIARHAGAITKIPEGVKSGKPKSQGPARRPKRVGRIHPWLAK